MRLRALALVVFVLTVPASSASFAQCPSYTPRAFAPGTAAPPSLPPGASPATGAPGRSTPAPAAPAQPAPATGAPSAAAPPNSHRRTNTGYVPTAEGTASWQLWWELNKAPYLDLRGALQSGVVLTGSDEFFLGQGGSKAGPKTVTVDDATFGQVVLPALVSRLDQERNAELLAAAVLALGEAGAGREQAPECAEHVLPFAGDTRRPVAEAATLALGLLGEPDTTAVLERLLSCDTKSLRLEDSLELGEHVPMRQRAFAAYALGLLGERSSGYTRTRIVNFLTGGVMWPTHRGAALEVRAASVIAMGLVPLPVSERACDGTRHPLVLMTRQEQMHWLLGVLEDPEIDHRVRSQAPISLARLMRDTPADFELRELVARRLIERLERRSDAPNEVQRSSALALGWIGDADEDEIDVAIRAALTEASEELVDQPAKHLALIALARASGRPGGGVGDPTAGAAATRRVLTRRLARGSTPVRPWSAIALAVLERSLDDRRQASSDDAKRALRDALERARSPEEIGACAIAVGLVRDPDAGPILMEKFADVRESEARGHLCVALGMVGHDAAADVLRNLCADSESQAGLQSSAATGLVLVGRTDVAVVLGELFGAAGTHADQVSLLRAIARAGDARSVAQLASASSKGTRTDAARAVAIAALGRVSEAAELPWSARLSVGAGYLSDVHTLTSVPRGAGVLDLAP